MARQQIGEVEITRDRVYRLDPQTGEGDTLASTVLVPPGTYPVFRDGLSHYWQMTGVLNHNSYRIGDGMFGLNPSGDVPSEDEVVFYSRRYGPDEWAELLNGFARDPEPRLIFTLNLGEPWPSADPEAEDSP